MAQRPSLIPVVIELGLSTSDELQEIQARQVIYGGDQQLNLAELRLLDEAQMLTVIGRAYNWGIAQPGPVLVNRHLSARLLAGDCDAVAGIDESGAWHAYVDHIDPQVAEQVRLICGDLIQIWLTTSLRMSEAQAALAGRRLEPRVNKVLGEWGPRLVLTEASSEANPEVQDAATQVATLPDVAPVPEEPAQEPTDVAPVAALPPVDAIPLAQKMSDAGLRPMSTKAVSLDSLEDQVPSSVGETAPPPKGYEDVTASSAAASQKAPQAAPETKEKYEAAQAIADLAQARSRDRVINILVEFAAGHFEYAAAFGLLSKEAKGLQSAGVGADTDRVSTLTIPLDLASAFSRAQQTGKAEVTRLRASGLEGGVARDLARLPGTEVFLLPIVVQGRALLLLWADNGGLRISDAALTALAAVADHVASAIARVLIERKRQSRVAQPSDLSGSLSPRGFSEAPPPVPTIVEAVRAEARASKRPVDPDEDLTRVQTTPKRINVDAISSGAPEAVEQAAELEAKKTETRRNPAAPAAEFPPEYPTGMHEVAPAKKRTLTRPTSPEAQDPNAPKPSEPPASFPPEPPKTLRGFPEVKSPSQIARDYETERRASQPEMPAIKMPDANQRPRLMSRRIVPVGQTNPPPGASERPPEALDSARTSGALRRPADAGGNHSSGAHNLDPSIPAAKTGVSGRVMGLLPEPDIGPVSEFAALSELEQKHAAFEAPAPAPFHNRSVHDTLLSRRAPLTEPDEDGWESPRQPSVRPLPPSLQTPTRARSYSDLVAELLNGNESVMQQLIDGGETAVGALIAEFPGPVKEPLTQADKASECGPILKALVALGNKATPFVTVRTADENAEVRRWATFLLGEFPGKEAAKAIASRLLDSSMDVRRAALSSARRARSDQLTRRMLRSQIEELCRDQNLPIEERASAIEALSDIREHEAIPTLLQLLETGDASLQRSCRWALSVLTRQDFGTDVSAWQQFWQQHRDEDRVEWLIASLDHEQRDIRRAAGEELRAVSGEDFGFNEDQSSAERRVVQAKFRSWWIDGGKAARI